MLETTLGSVERAMNKTGFLFGMPEAQFLQWQIGDQNLTAQSCSENQMRQYMQRAQHSVWPT